MSSRTPLATVSAVLAALTVTFGSSSPADACSCDRPSLLDDFRSSDVVLVATVTDVSESAGTHWVRVRVLHTFVGNLGDETTLLTGPQTAACGYPFEVGSTYLVFANGRDRWVGLCGATQPISGVQAARDVLAGVRPPPVLSSDRPDESALDRALIDHLNARDPADLAWAVPGAYPVRESRATSGLALRGALGRRLLLLQDGIRLDSAILGDQVDPAFGLIDLYSLSRIEVLPGPRSSRTGPGSLGGTIQLLSRRPLGSPHVHSALHTSFASSDLAFETAPRLHVALGPVTVLGGATHRITGDLNPGSPLPDDLETRYRRYGGDVQLGLHTDAGDIRLLYAGMRQTIPNDVSMPEFGERARDFAWIGFSSEPHTDWLARGELRVGYVRQQQAHPTERGGGAESLHRLALVGDAESPLGDTTRLRWGLALHGERLDLDPPIGDNGPAAGLADGSEAVTGGPYTALSIELSERTALDLGARLSWMAASVPASGDAQSSIHSSASGSGHAELHHQFAAWLSSRLAVHGGVRFPNLSELHGFRRTPEGTFVPNPDLRNEHAIEAQAALTLNLAPFTLTVGGHYLTLFDLIAVGPTGEHDADNLDGAGAPLPVLAARNSGDAHVYGAETVLRAQVADFGFHFDLAWTEGDALSPAGPPPVHGVLAVRYATPTWGVGPHTRYSFAASATGPASQRTDGFAVVGLTGYVRWADWGRLILTLDNLADQGYRTHGSSIPEPGFNGALTLTLSWP